MQPLTFVPVAFVCVIDPLGAIETALRRGSVVGTSEPINEAAWLRPRKSRRREGDWRLAPPFDNRGGDALGLMQLGSPFRPEGDPLRRWRGTVRALADDASADPGQRALVLRDAWVADQHDWRATEMRDFELHGARGDRVMVRCSKAPLVVAPPQPFPAVAVLSTLHPATLAALQAKGSPREDDMAAVVDLWTGDVVDVLGIERGTDFVEDLSGGSSGYRATAGQTVPVLGDRPDVRLVLVRVGAA